MVETLARLASRYRRVAVVSGRPVAYLLEHLGEAAGAGGVELIGLYGTQRTRWDAGEQRVAVEESTEAARWRDVLSDSAERAEAAAPAGTTVERKGLAVTLHYRRAPEHAGWVQDFASAEAGRTGLVAHPGKMSFELRPPVVTDKGTVVEELAAGLRAVLFAGDDVGDVPAFEALRRLRGAGVDTLAVAVGGTETPADVTRAADVVVDGPAGVLQLLNEIASG